MPVECHLTRRTVHPSISHSFSFWFARRRFFYAVKLLCVVIFSYGNVSLYLLFKFNFRVPLLLLFRTMLCFVLFSGPWVHTLVHWGYDHYTRKNKRHLQTLYKLRCTLAPLRTFISHPNFTSNSHADYFHDAVPVLVLNTLRTGSFKLFKRPLPGFLTILTL